MLRVKATARLLRLPPSPATSTQEGSGHCRTPPPQATPKQLTLRGSPREKLWSKGGRRPRSSQLCPQGATGPCSSPSPCRWLCHSFLTCTGGGLVFWCLRLIFVSSRPSRTRETERRPAGYPRQGSVRPDRPLVRVGPSLGQRSDLGTGPAPELWGHSRDHGGRSPRAPLLGREGERHAKTATPRRGEAGAPGGGHGTCGGPGVGTDARGCRGRGAGAAGRRD